LGPAFWFIQGVLQVHRKQRASMADDGGLSEQELRRTRQEFFAAGVEKWIEALGDLTFPSVSLPLGRDTALELARAGPGGQFDDHGALAHAIDTALAAQGWTQAFVKLSTRSPKDAPQILEKASASFVAQRGETLPANDRCKLFSALVQENFCISSGPEAVELLAASERVREDCAYATESDDYSDLNVHVVLRRWDGPIPPSNEFRGIIWQGRMHALSQYYHGLFFPELEAIRASIEDDLRNVHATIQPKLSAMGFECYIVDLAWLGPGKVRVIEVNPFDGVGLGTMAASTCLFRWDDPGDKLIITEGPFEFRLRTEAQSEYELKRKMNTEWREIIFPPKWRSSRPKPYAGGEPSVKGRGKGSEKGKGKGKESCIPAA